MSPATTEHSAKELRFVVLRHEGIADPHFDLMLELEPGAPLATWRSPVWPLRDGTPLVRLRDHRREYFTFEGEISGGRGFVRRVAAGALHRVFTGRMTVIVRLGPSSEGEEWLISDRPGGSVAVRPGAGRAEP